MNHSYQTLFILLSLKFRKDNEEFSDRNQVPKEVQIVSLTEKICNFAQ